MSDFGIKTHSIGRDGYAWWVGHIAREDSWKKNKPPNPQTSNEGVPGVGERYRVAMISFTPFDTEEVKDEELAWASVEYPVTAGSGGRSSSQSANLAQGDFVRGYFLDGEEGQIPIISAVLGRTEYQRIVKNRVGTARYDNISGYNFNTNPDFVAYYSQLSGPIGELVDPFATEENGGNIFVSDQNNNGIPIIWNESCSNSSSLIDVSSTACADEPTVPLAVSSDCEPIPLGRIQKEIQNIVVEIQKIQKSIYDYSNAVNNQIGDIQDKINRALTKASELVASGIKWIFTEIQKFVIKTTNDVLKKTYFLLFPNERPELKVAVENINDLIACLFRKLIGELLPLIGNFLLDAANKVINGVECLVENLIGNILGNLIGGISDIINGALSTVTALVGQTVGIVGEILGIIKDVLSFLSCEEKPRCSFVDEWNILSGASKSFTGDIESIISKSKNVSASIQNSIDSAGNNIDNALDINFDDVFNQTGCDIGPVLCGPPEAQFFGSGVGAAGNLIIGSLGEVIGIDMINFGSGYDNDSYGKVYDNCGKGKAAYFRPIISDYVDDQGNQQTGGIVDIEIIESGTGYLNAPDGSRGGNEYTWADPEDTVINYPDGTWLPIPPGQLVSVVPNITVITPPNTVITTEPQLGSDAENIIVLIPGVIPGTGPIITPGPGDGPGIGPGGTITTPGQGDGPGGAVVPGITDDDGGQGGGEIIFGGNPYIVKSPGIFTTPKPDYQRSSGDFPTSSTGSYPVILYLCEVFIDESGINYSPEDKIIITPDIGAVAEPKFDQQGRVVSVKVTVSGEGFTEYPKLYIQSETGYNAILRPKLCIDRIGNDELKEPTLQDKIVTVIDCVGKI